MTPVPSGELAEDRVTVRLGPRSYDIVLGRGMTAQFGLFVRELLPQSQTALLVADEHTRKLAAPLTVPLGEAGFRTALAVIPAGEQSKSLEQLARLYDALYELKADRRTPVIAVGGGVVGDLAGFAAATYNRGLPLIMVPTTLLAMVDSSVGGKTAINHPRGKNLIGAFHQPKGVWIDTDHLATLPVREYRSGLAEVVKYGVIRDAELFEILECHAPALRNGHASILPSIIARCCRIKAEVVEQDEYEETGLRAILNYGHTFGHAFEIVGAADHWLHGEAVAAGMMCAVRLAQRLGYLEDDSLPSRQEQLLRAFDLPIRPLPHWDVEALLAAMQRDKKATAGRLRFVLPRCLGEVGLVDHVPLAEVRQILCDR
ncbi:3-dehydroquinate synthase [Thermogemmata fonticola]|uniref:3-dehydroquinate synthase n=1 Tax=Thermogemmata fonticola TaxID=2755323 RepID=A0A7V8VCG8_9BACT|nr:3-dehydroquinate synthase [Thermogemmata fonticola]MBA2225237.1 3-dehydroquinate synthase [Thermogemmata fonticola]